MQYDTTEAKRIAEPGDRDAVAEIERLREALREAADAMTCGPDKHGDNPAHYCPNCDNTSFNARANIRALLGGDHGHD